MAGGGDTCAATGRYGVDEFTVAAVLDARAEQCPDRIMMTIAGEPISFAQMRDRSNAAANVLLAYDISSGDTVALFGGSTPHWVYFWLGAARIGAVSAAVNAANKGDYLRRALATSRARVVVTDTPERRKRVFDVGGDVEGLHTVLDAGECSDALNAASTAAPSTDAAHGDDDTRALFFTSGTTGPSKAVVTNWRYLFNAAATVAQAWEFRAEEVIWSAMPLFHLSAAATILAPMLVGGTTVLAPSFHPKSVWDEIRACNAIGFVGAGAMVSMLLNLPPDHGDAELGLRFISAAPISADVYRDIERRYNCRIVTMYGLTEAFPLAVKRVGEHGTPGSSGRVNDDFEVAILDDDAKPVMNTVGEIACRPRIPGVMSEGYVDPNCLSGLRVSRHDEWFRTGDLGRVDVTGQLTYVDRAKDSIRRRGENVSSAEVEAVVTRHPSIGEAAAVAVPSEVGEDDILVVVTVSGEAAFDPRSLLDFCSDHMPYFCVPRYVRVVDELPKNVVGRVQKHLLRATGTGADSWDRESNGYVVHR